MEFWGSLLERGGGVLMFRCGGVFFCVFKGLRGFIFSFDEF